MARTSQRHVRDQRRAPARPNRLTQAREAPAACGYAGAVSLVLPVAAVTYRKRLVRDERYGTRYGTRHDWLTTESLSVTDQKRPAWASAPI